MSNIEIIDGKIWIQRDETEYGIANELVAAGIPKDKIVLAFHPEDVRDFQKIKHPRKDNDNHYGGGEKAAAVGCRFLPSLL